MHIKVKVITKSKAPKVLKVEHPLYDYKVYVKAAPDKGKANTEVIGLLAKFFDVSKININILTGYTNNIKTVGIQNDVVC